jgi:MFS family permease
LPIPVSVFLSSQLVSKVLVGRVRPKVLMLTGISITIVSLLLASQLHAGVSYSRILVCLVLLGLGSGTSLVSLTTASLSGVQPADAGAASGLVNVIQQVGAALGLAVLVTVLSAADGHSQLASGVGAPASLVHGLDVTFGAGALFGLIALVMVAVLIRLPAAAPSSAASTAREGAEVEVVDGEGFEWSDPELVA